jgi:pyruvate/2-oxoglutarate dehydrogenase complex dihydrolipoamide acyltransferase (E2) component
VFRYRDIDVAFTARSHDGHLFTPVVRQADRLSLDETAARCSEVGMATFRGKLTAKDSTGACLTVSLLADQPIRLHVGLQNAYQSAILTAGAIREEVRLQEGQPVAVPTWTLVLSYDHGLMDGWDAALCLDAARKAVETLQF